MLWGQRGGEHRRCSGANGASKRRSRCPVVPFSRRAAGGAPAGSAQGRIKGFFAFVVGTVCIGALVGLIAAPATIRGRRVVRGTQMWQDMSVDVPFDASLPQRSIMVDRNGTPYATLYAEDRIPVARDQLSPLFVDALVATEDVRFFEHGGVDMAATGRAPLNNVLGGNRQGASTITQQWIKNLTQAAADTQAKREAADDVSIERKLLEARAAAEAEQRFSKDEILTRYVNTAFYGNGACGIGAASARYFSTTPDKLTSPRPPCSRGAQLARLFRSDRQPRSGDQAPGGRARPDGGGRQAHAAGGGGSQGRAACAHPSQPNNGCAVSTFPIFCQWVKGRSSPTHRSAPPRRATGAALPRWSAHPDDPGPGCAGPCPRRPRGLPLEATNRVADAIAVVQPGTGEVLALASNRPWGSDVAAARPRCYTRWSPTSSPAPPSSPSRWRRRRERLRPQDRLAGTGALCPGQPELPRGWVRQLR